MLSDLTFLRDAIRVVFGIDADIVCDLSRCSRSFFNELSRDAVIVYEGRRSSA